MRDNFSGADLVLLFIIIGMAALMGATLFVGAVKLSLMALGVSTP